MKPPAADGRLRLLVLSHVLPFPRSAGQHQRVFYTLQAARRKFHVTFATVAGHEAPRTRKELSSLCDDIVVLPSLYRRNYAAQLFHRAAGVGYAAMTGLKRSNYAIGQVEFHSGRLERVLDSKPFDCVLFEYWHAAAATSVFREKNIPCVLDMHDILWKSYAQSLESSSGMPGMWKDWALRRYKAEEERAWSKFDAIIAINRDEELVVREVVGHRVAIFHAAMGTDLDLWPYSWDPATPPRIAYYGGLGNGHNEQCALRCALQVMPLIWSKVPKAELWLVGANPPESLRRLSADSRVHVTGFVEDVQQVLRTMTAVVCPWTGKFGFRSRLIEVMALGVPVVATPDAVHGMELKEHQGVLLAETDGALADHAVRLATDPAFARDQSCKAREQVERCFSVGNTYDRFVEDLSRWLDIRSQRAQTLVRFSAAAPEVESRGRRSDIAQL
jgi:glycosyltransferase involved in cell wall biosynthesis